MRKTVCVLCALIALFVSGCGYKLGYRHFAGPIFPAETSNKTGDFAVGDDHSITYRRDRLEVTLLPLTIEILNRQFANHSKAPEGFDLPNPHVVATNPYTYGDWLPPGEEQAPPRFTVFLLKVKNYAFPKVSVDPASIELVATNGRRYPSLSMLALTDYFWPYAIAYSGNARKNLQERRSLIRRTLYTNEMVFSGQEKEGYIVFQNLDADVEKFTVLINDMVLRFDYRDEPIETVDIPYEFQREVYYARHPRPDKG